MKKLVFALLLLALAAAVVSAAEVKVRQARTGFAFGSRLALAGR